MKLTSACIAVALAMFSTSLLAEETTSGFSYDKKRLPGAKPWTSQPIQNDPAEFQFVVIGDRTGGANQEGTFKLAIDQLNLLQPEFVINVGDLIEGYSDDKAELNAEWDEVDELLSKLKMPFVRTPGNHDIANKTAQQVWRDRHGATYYHFVYKYVLFMVLDSEDPPRAAPEGMKDKLELYNRLQVEDPAKAREMLAEFMTDEAVVAALGKPVEFGDKQMAWIKKTLADNPDVRWTFLFLHEPAWENASDNFKAIQKMLKARKHTFLAGHLHYYDYDLLDGSEHITMGPAGASFHQEGPGNVDHIMWVTMTEEGPQIGNIALKGIFDRKGLDPELFGAYDRKGADEEAKPKKDE
ncbi:Calcineurin-like phosphoesterase superfamily domain protein [Microbulbifer aggregans]|uniref:Calcineurin-like phosphoesterase superfamily domain protein n=1 Tax=Microbulbifer aggregans TaxID=1769779 RepID=A0A1C9W3F3_9GAMM|nr:metallophosphoesterase [Microbulbifer aggregans]AOS95671.1 Calcineurin-like phosphoesterase superfamily domain protein [Microbulbifer aggregans]